MGLFVCVTEVEAPEGHCSFEYTADASMLGWAPGFFPTELETNMGNAQNLVRVSLDEYSALYKQIAGCVSLRVFND